MKIKPVVVLQSLLIRAGLCLTLVTIITACASFPVNPPLSQYDETHGYRGTNLAIGDKNTEETFVLVALSGGGTRAAALNYGVFKYLDTVMIDGERSLLDEFDIISSSSAASFTSSYYGLYGKEKFLAQFPDDILYRRLQSEITRKLFNPFHWPRLWSAKFSRSDLFAEHFDKHIYHEATFADIRRERPMIVINATDMGIGSQFPFVQGKFDALCSDLDGVLVSRAVTASMAFTPAFTPVAFKNYPSEECGYERAGWIDKTLAQGVEDNALLYARAVDFLSYEDVEHRPYIHLLDSGIADNMGIRVATLPFAVRNEPWSQADRLLDGTIKRLVVIIVDAKPKTHFAGDLKARPPRIISSVSTAASVPLGNSSFETVDMIRRTLNDFQQRVVDYEAQIRKCEENAAEMCELLNGDSTCPEKVLKLCNESFGVLPEERPSSAEVYLLHISFSVLDDEAERERFQGIPTSLQLSPEIVDSVIEVAPRLINEIPDFHRLVSDLGGSSE